MESGIVKTSGADIYYESHGDGPAIVLAHGIGGNHAIWFQQIDALARSNRVIIFDHRGFGLSVDHNGQGRSAFVGDLTALLDHLQIERAALVGQSMGAGTCIGFATQFPGRVAALAIADSLHGIAEAGDFKMLMDEARQATKNLDQIERVLGRSACETNPYLATLYRQINSFNIANRHNLTGSFATITPSELGALQCPVLFIAGQQDILFPIDAIRKVQDKVAGSFLVEIHDAGHSAFLEKPREFNDTILSLLAMAGHVGKMQTAHSNVEGYTPA